MTDNQILEILEQIRPNIKKLAWVFISKMKQPSIYTLEDLEQEGEKNVILHIRLGRLDETKGKPSTYLIRSVVTHFIDLMHQSYKFDPTEDEETIRTVISRNSSSFMFDELNTLLWIEEILSTRELEYLATMLYPAERIREQFSKNRKIVRKLVRQSLNMTSKEERTVREEIRRKLCRRED